MQKTLVPLAIFHVSDKESDIYKYALPKAKPSSENRTSTGNDEGGALEAADGDGEPRAEIKLGGGCRGVDHVKVREYRQRNAGENGQRAQNHHSDKGLHLEPHPHVAEVPRVRLEAQCRGQDLDVRAEGRR